jgi:hypothetical protein
LELGDNGTKHAAHPVVDRRFMTGLAPRWGSGRGVAKRTPLVFQIDAPRIACDDIPVQECLK